MTWAAVRTVAIELGRFLRLSPRSYLHQLAMRGHLYEERLAELGRSSAAIADGSSKPPAADVWPTGPE